MTYLLLNLVFLAVAACLIAGRDAFNIRAVSVTLAALLAMTAVFDNLIIMAGIVDYDPSKILGIYINQAPVEDFFYAVLAAILVPALWNKIGKEKT